MDIEARHRVDIYEANYRKLMALVPTVHEGRSFVIEMNGCSALSVEVLYRFGPTMMLSLSQHCEHPLGHVVADPSMIVAVYSGISSVEARVFQNHLGTRRIYFDDIAVSADISIKRSMNQFLGDWLASLLASRAVLANAGTPLHQRV